MKKLRALLIGLMLGGGLGAQLGSFISTLMITTNTFLYIEMGLLIGGLAGIGIAAVIIVANNGMANK